MNQHNDRMLAGYRVVYKPEHFHHTLNFKNYNGYVYEHRYVMECALGRALGKNEIVHHKDGNKLNNDISNLELTNRGEHVHRHMGEAKVAYCIDCGVRLSDSRAIRCRDCANIYARVVKERPSKDELQKMVDDTSYSAVSRIFGVSDNTIRKWMR